MIKRALIAAGALALLAGFFFGADAFSYIGTSAGWVQDSVRDSVPIEFEMQRARKMLKDLQPVVNENRRLIAHEEVELERLQRQITAHQAKLDRDRREILTLRSDLSTGKDVFSYGSREYSLQEVKTDLARRFERFKTSDATLESMRKMREARQRSVEAAHKKLEGVLAAQRQLEVEIENLQAQHQLVEAAEATSEYNFNEGELSRLKELVADLQTRLEVRAKLADQEADAYYEIPVSEPTPENILDQVTEYFEANPEQIVLGN